MGNFIGFLTVILLLMLFSWEQSTVIANQNIIVRNQSIIVSNQNILEESLTRLKAEKKDE